MKGNPRRAWRNRSGSALIIVLGISLAMVSIALLFADAMKFEYRSADNYIAGLEAENAIEGARRYIIYMLENAETPGAPLDPDLFVPRQVPVGESTFWIVGRSNEENSSSEQTFDLTYESSKINLNTATADMLELLPRMTVELAAAIIDWRDTDSDVTQGGAENESYLLKEPKRLCKNSPFETVEELRLVYGMTTEILYGEDANQNGILDPNEDDGDVSLPLDNRNGLLEPGLIEYVTVFSKESNKQADGTARVSVREPNQIQALLQEKLGNDRASKIQRVQNPRSVLEYFIKSGLSKDEFKEIEDALTAGSGDEVEGLINVNTASETVLTCLPGVGQEFAAALVAARKDESIEEPSIAWVADVLEDENAIEAGPFITSHINQYTADIVAFGRERRGFKRELIIFDTTGDSPTPIFRKDRSRLGMPLSKRTREELLNNEGKEMTLQ